MKKVYSDLSAEGMALTAMYIAIGADRALQELPSDEYELRVEGIGHVGYMGELVQYADLLQSMWEGKGEEACCSGVFDYDVSEPFGAWFVKEMPTDEQARAWLVEHFNKLFE
jgi:hypothetical protein